MKRLKKILKNKSGRDSAGHIAVRHKGGRHKRFLRKVDFARSKRNIEGRVVKIEYDPNRTANLALVAYTDGEYRYMIAPSGLKSGDVVVASEQAPVQPGNALPLRNIPVGTSIYNIEIVSGKGGQIVRSAQSSAIIQGREEGMILVKLPSGELRRFDENAWATVGEVGGTGRGLLTKAGQKRHMGVRPTVRGTAMHPDAHPHGGGEGRSGEGMPPKTPWGKPARGVKTRRKNKYSNNLIIKRRKIGYGSK